MKRFDFKLDAVLRYRTYQTQIALMKLAEAKQQRLTVERKIREIGEKKQSGNKDLQRQLTHGMGAERFRIYCSYLEGLDERMAVQERRLREVTALLEERRRVAEVERMKKEALECLEEKQKRVHFQRLERAEEKAVDEVLTLRYEVG